MSALGMRFTLLSRYIRSLRGGSQPILAEASDGQLYVVKFADNLQGPNVPFNEAMGTELYSACGLPVAPWKILQVTDSFLDQNPFCWPDTPQGRRRPAAGLCFGSLFIGSMGIQTFELLPGNWFKCIKNAENFWLAWLLDICARHSDIRQAIFITTLAGQFQPVFIDFGHMFEGATGNDPFRNARASRYLDPRIYPLIKKNFLLKARRIVDSLDSDGLRWRLAGLPDEWKTRSALQSFAGCLDRISNSHFVDETLETMVKYNERIAFDNLYPICRRKPENPIPRSGLQPGGSIQRSVA